MEPFPDNAVAVEWEFRCTGREVAGPSWEWRCRARDGAVVAKSRVTFRSLREAISDAVGNGFQYGTRTPESPRNADGRARPLQ